MKRVIYPLLESVLYPKLSLRLLHTVPLPHRSGIHKAYLFMPVWNHITPPGAKHNTIQYLVINYFHISNRMLKRPLPNSIKIPTYMFRVELRPGQWVVRYHVKCEQANVGVTLNVLTQHLDAVVCAIPVSPRIPLFQAQM